MIVKYEPRLKSVWDDVVKDSVNGTFLFYRDYMDYHSDIYADHSVIVYTENKGYPIAVFPANYEGHLLYSHQGLTYGGLVWRKAKQERVCQIMQEICDYYKQQTIDRIYYKTIPYIYHKVPAQADLYALYLLKAKMYRRDVLSVLDYRTMNKSYPLQKLHIALSHRWDEYWPILIENLKTKYNKWPVHSVEEIKSLATQFPNNIQLITAVNAFDEIVGGLVMYITSKVAHNQYAAQSPKGQELGAMTELYNFGIRLYNRLDLNYWDFGISTEWGGEQSTLNPTLICFKEKWGSTSVVHDFYKIYLN